MPAGRGLSVIMVALVLLAQSPAAALTLREFAGGQKEATADLNVTGGFSFTVNLSIAAQCRVLSATVNLTGLAAPGNMSAYPPGASLRLGDEVLWAFNGTGMGPLGRQELFSGGGPRYEAVLGAGGGTATPVFKMPATALARTATVELDCRGPERLLELANLSGTGRASSFFGYSLASCDINGDGWDDIIVGAPNDNAGGVISGSVHIYFGGLSPSSTPDRTLNGAAFVDFFGCSVAGAGDVNGDGWEDLIVGAPQNFSTAYMAGRAYIYFGGPGFDLAADVVLDGAASAESFGDSVAGAGDVNGDGYADVVVGAPGSNAGGQGAGRAYLFLGGRFMDTQPDLNLTGAAVFDAFGYSVAGAGDFNGDGYDDIAAGAYYNDLGGTDAGAAYLFFGGPRMGTVANITFTGTGGEGLGWRVAGAGDVNGDGYDDILCGAPLNGAGGQRAGAAYIYFGGEAVDAFPDVTVHGAAEGGRLGYSLSGAGDVNNDGYDDVIIGAPYDSSVRHFAGSAHVLFGGAGMDAAPDIRLDGAGENDSLGFNVGGGGDINGDGWGDPLVGIPYSYTGSSQQGRALAVSRAPFMERPELRLDDAVLWSGPERWAGPRKISGFPELVNHYLSQHASWAYDGFNNPVAEVPLSLSAAGEGKVALQALNITYNYTARAPDFAAKMNAYIDAHRGEKGPGGNITVPLRVLSGGAGRVRLANLTIVVDLPPWLARPLPPLRIDEDTFSPGLIDLFDYFKDDFDPGPALTFTVVSADYGHIVPISIGEGHFLQADALNGAANDNWTGTVRVVLRCTDRSGLSTDSDPFDIVVRNLNDAPAFTSAPPTGAVGGMEYTYQATAADGDGDTVTFGLSRGPKEMTIEPRTGRLRWTPSGGGAYNITLLATDGKLQSYQDFVITVVILNKAPKLIGAPPTEAYAAREYVCDVMAMDPDGDTLAYSLLQWPGEMVIDNATGRIRWTPSVHAFGNYSVTLRITDGKGGELWQNFTINVRPFSGPKVSIARPRPGSTLSGSSPFSGRADNGTLWVSGMQYRIDSGNWTDLGTNGSWTVNIDTRQLRDGYHVLQVRATDAAGNIGSYSVRFSVDNSQEKGNLMVPLLLLLVLAVMIWTAAALLRRRRHGPGDDRRD